MKNNGHGLKSYSAGKPLCCVGVDLTAIFVGQWASSLSEIPKDMGIVNMNGHPLINPLTTIFLKLPLANGAGQELEIPTLKEPNGLKRAKLSQYFSGQVKIPIVLHIGTCC